MWPSSLSSLTEPCSFFERSENGRDRSKSFSSRIRDPGKVLEKFQYFPTTLETVALYFSRLLEHQGRSVLLRVLNNALILLFSSKWLQFNLISVKYKIMIIHIWAYGKRLKKFFICKHTYAHTVHFPNESVSWDWNKHQSRDFEVFSSSWFSSY